MMMIGVDSDGAECEASLPDSGPHLRTTTQVPEPHIVNDIKDAHTSNGIHGLDFFSLL